MVSSGFEQSGRAPASRARRARGIATLLVALLALGAARLAAQTAAPGDDELRVYAHTLQYQPAAEALAVVRPLLSPRGTVELQPGGNTIVVRDSVSALARIAPMLQQFDHRPETLRLEVQMVQAYATQSFSPAIAPPLTAENDVSPALVKRMRQLLRYEIFRLAASARLDVHEGEQVLYELGGVYTVGFKLGTVMGDKRVKLHDFRIVRRAVTGAFAKPEQQLIGTNINLWLDQTLILGLAKDEAAGDALMVVVSCSRPK
jgi:type II/III secretion system protein